MGFERRAQDLTLADGSTVKTQMLSVGGTGISGFVGLGPYGSDSNGNGKIDASEVNPNARGIGVRDVEFGLAMFTSEEAAYAGKRWTALTASVGAIDTLVGLPEDLKFQIHDLGVDVNQVSGYAAGEANAKVIDFAKRTVAGVVQDRSVSLVTGTGKSLALTHDGLRGNMLRASGGVTLDVAGFFMASGTMSIEKSSQTVTLANATQVNVDMLTIGGTGLDAFVGVNGPYRSDTNGDGKITLADATNPNAVGLTLSQAQFGLALLYEKDGGSRNWISLEASALEVGLVGVPIVSATAQNLSVGINLVRGVAANSDANLQVIDYAGTHTDGSTKALSVYTGYGQTMAINMAGSKGELVQASGDFALSLADFVTVRGSLAFEKSRGAITLANGQTLVVDTLRVGGTGIRLGGNGVGGVQLDAAQLAGLNLPSLVLGSDGGSNPISLGGAGSSVSLTIPLVVMAQGEGGHIEIGGSLSGTSLAIYGPGHTTVLADGTNLVMTQGLLVDDALSVQGAVSLTVGSADGAADLHVTGRVNGGLGEADVLTLDAIAGSIAVDHRGGDVVISGTTGLKITGITSMAQDGWVTMLSGRMGLVETAGVISMENGQVARISGRSIITRDVLSGRHMGGSDVYYVANPALQAPPSISTLSDFNARLAQQWMAPGQGESAAARLSSKVADLSTPMQLLTGSDNGMAAFAPSVLAALDAPATISALLDAAMKVMAQDQGRSASASDTYTNWDQRSYVSRPHWLPVEATVESPPVEVEAPVAPVPSPLPTPVASNLQKGEKRPLPPKLDLTILLGQTDLTFLPQLAIPVAVEPMLEQAFELDEMSLT